MFTLMAIETENWRIVSTPQAPNRFLHWVSEMLGEQEVPIEEDHNHKKACQ